jgi:hypothetical protein
MNGILKKAACAASLACALCAASFGASADWSVADLDTLKDAFVSGISSKYQATEYAWNFLDVSHCFDPGVTCSGTNPDSPYGYVAFSPRSLATKLSQTDGLVLIMETPPSMRYFAVTPYIYSRFYQSIPSKPGQAGFVPVFESLGDSVNVTNIQTAGSSAPGQNDFTQLSVFVVTADRITYAQIKNQFLALGFPDYAINQIALPLNAVPLNMGTALTDDTFSVLLRLAYPEDPTQMQDYIARAPIKALLLSPLNPRPVFALPTPESKVPGSGSAESADLATARDQLVDQLKARYGSAYDITEQDVKLAQTRNYVCVQFGLDCAGDNPDALYAQDLKGYIPGSREDKILIVGVNHVDTGKARYISHSIVNAEHQAGVAAANDTWLQGTALLMAGITDPNDPRYATYSQLYAFTISYDCTGELACKTIPEPTDTDPVGVAFGQALNITSRYYVDPATGTRPSIDEVIPHRVFVLKKK